MSHSAVSQPSTRNGSCLCGNIRFELTGEPFMFILCHCTNCKKVTGTSFTANVHFKISQVKIVDEQKHLRSYKVSNTGPDVKPLDRQFCGNCGSTLFIVSEDRKDALIVANGAVNDTTGWKPKRELFCGGREEWLPEFATERL